MKKITKVISFVLLLVLWAMLFSWSADQVPSFSRQMVNNFVIFCFFLPFIVIFLTLVSFTMYENKKWQRVAICFNVLFLVGVFSYMNYHVDASDAFVLVTDHETGNVNQVEAGFIDPRDHVDYLPKTLILCDSLLGIQAELTLSSTPAALQALNDFDGAKSFTEFVSIKFDEKIAELSETYHPTSSSCFLCNVTKEDIRIPYVDCTDLWPVR